MHPGCTIDLVYLYREPIDFRKAIDGLSALVELELGQDQGAVLAPQRFLPVAKAPGARQIRLAKGRGRGQQGHQFAGVRLAARRLRFMEKYTS